MICHTARAPTGMRSESWIQLKMTDQWLLSARADRFFLIATFLQFIFLAGAAVYLYRFLNFATPQPLRLTAEISLGALIILTVVSGILLSEGMRAYWQRFDTSSGSQRLRRRLLLTLGV